jgi:hypothetical protein
MRQLRVCAANPLHTLTCRCYGGEEPKLVVFCGMSGHLFKCRCQTGAKPILQGKYMRCLLDIEHHINCDCWISGEVLPSYKANM